MLSRAWKVWAAENLLRGVPRAAIVDRLRAESIPEDAVADVMDELEGSPFLEAARPLVRDARRFEMIARRDARLRGAAPRTVPRRANVSADELYELHYAPGVPVILTDVVPRWPAFGRWTPRGLAERFGDVEVEITIDRANDPTYARTFRRRAATVTMRELALRIESAETPTNDFYLVAQNKALERTPLGVLLSEIEMPPGWMDAALRPEDASLWMGPAGTVTALHHDFTNLLYCALHGRKRWRLVPPTERALLDRVTAQHTLLDPSRDLGDDAIVLDVVVAPGEALFVPVGWWHHVVALDASIGVSLTGFSRREGRGDDFAFFRPGSA
jgi:hypothetical protein